MDFLIDIQGLILRFILMSLARTYLITIGLSLHHGNDESVREVIRQRRTRAREAFTTYNLTGRYMREPRDGDARPLKDTGMKV